MAFAQVGIVGCDGLIELQALRLFGLPEAAPAVLYVCPAVPIGTREFQAEVSWDLLSLASGATALPDVTVTGTRQRDIAQSPVSSTWFMVRLPSPERTTRLPWTLALIVRETTGRLVKLRKGQGVVAEHHRIEVVA